MFAGFILALCLGRATCSGAFANGSECGLPCRGLRILRSVISSTDDVSIATGVKLVREEGPLDRSFPVPLPSALKRLVSGYDLRVNLLRFLPTRDEIASGVRAALSHLEDIDSGDDGRKGGKKGSGVLMMAAMMGGTMAALGFGGLGMLAMKALTVSAMALLMSVVMGLKKLASKHEHESGHIVSYMPLHGVRRKRRNALTSPTAMYEAADKSLLWGTSGR